MSLGGRLVLAITLADDERFRIRGDAAPPPAQQREANPLLGGLHGTRWRLYIAAILRWISECVA